MRRMLVVFVVVSAFVLVGPSQQRDIPAPSRNSAPLLLAQSPWPRPCPPECGKQAGKTQTPKNKSVKKIQPARSA